MERIRRFALALAVSTFAVAALAQTEVTVWFHSGKGPEREALAAQVQAFNAQQDQYRVVADQLPEGTYNDQVQAAALSNDLPCLLDFDGPFIYNYAWSGFLQPIDAYVSDDLRADVLPSILAQEQEVEVEGEGYPQAEHHQKPVDVRTNFDLSPQE
jgi:multiple sugar transport system substrate-binding protein